MADLSQLEEQIVSLSLLEAAALVKALESRLGVSAAAAAPVAVAGGGGAAAVAEVVEQTEFQVPHWFTEGLAVSYEGLGTPPRSLKRAARLSIAPVRSSRRKARILSPACWRAKLRFAESRSATAKLPALAA